MSHQTPSARQHSAVFDPQVSLLTTPLSSLVKRAPITSSPHTTIRETALLMSRHRVSSMLIVQDGHLFGIVTDRDLRNRVIAAGAPLDAPIMEIATLAPMTVQIHQPAFDALMLMAKHGINHVPILEGQAIRGVLTSTELTELHSTSAVFMVGDIYKQMEVEGIKQVVSRVRALQLRLTLSGASAESIGHIVTAITDAVTDRLVQLAEIKFGPTPVEYCWVCAGSQARNEQTAKSDQDNCLLIGDEFREDRHGEYFKSFAHWVCAGLDACGYVYCPGDMMAQNDMWRQPVSVWETQFARWIAQPDPQSLMLTTVFFDLRAVSGQAALLERLRDKVLQATRDNPVYLSFLANIALTHKPALGMFNRLKTIGGGEHAGTIDLKMSGVVPVVDLARVYALAHGSEVVNTQERLRAATGGKEITEQSGRDLSEAFEYIGYLRLQHQARQVQAGQTPNNYLNPETLSGFEKGQLRFAFEVIKALQHSLGHRYQTGRF